MATHYPIPPGYLVAHVAPTPCPTPPTSFLNERHLCLPLLFQELRVWLVPWPGVVLQAFCKFLKLGVLLNPVM